MNAKQIAVLPMSINGDCIDLVTITIVNPERFGLSEHALKSVLAPTVVKFDTLEQVVEMVKKLCTVKSALDKMWWTDESVVENAWLGMKTQEWAIGCTDLDFDEYFSDDTHPEDVQEVLEYEVETADGELVNCFTWAELRAFFKNCPISTLKMAAYRGTILLGKYKISKVRYLWEKGL